MKFRRVIATIWFVAAINWGAVFILSIGADGYTIGTWFKAASSLLFVAVGVFFWVVKVEDSEVKVEDGEGVI